jgi:methionine-rich copper-binding protein CopC
MKARMQLRCWRHCSWALFALILLLAGASQSAWAHAILMESTPKANSAVKGPDLAILLRFNVRVDGGRSRLHLMAADGSTATLGAVQQPSPDSLQSSASGLKPGAYRLRWQVLAADGHISRGEVPFTVN